MWCNVRNGDPLEVLLAQPRGFRAGVVRAIEIVERAIDKYRPPVYVRHEIVHNKYVVESLKNKGAIFIEDLPELPPRAVTAFSVWTLTSGTVTSDAAPEAKRFYPQISANVWTELH